jgi:hypothetical protein
MGNDYKITCSGCQKEIYAAEAKNTIIGNLCKGCYNLFLDFRVKSTKERMKSNIFVFLVPSIIFLVFFGSNYQELMRYEVEPSTLVFMLLISSFGATRLMKNGFIEVGETVRKEYYKATFTSDDDFTVTDHSYNTYTAEQWISILLNIIMFIIGVAVTLGLGVIVFLIGVMSYRRAKRQYEHNYIHGLNPGEARVSTDELMSYKGLIAQKALDMESDNSSYIEGIKMEHVGYVFHEQSLYGAITSSFNTPKFEKDVVYFIQLFKHDDHYVLVDPGSTLYRQLYKEFKGSLQEVSGNNKDAVSSILDPDDKSNVTLYGNDARVEFEQIAVVTDDDDIYAILKPVVPLEDDPEHEFVVFQIIIDGDDADVSYVTDDDTLDMVSQKFQELLE